MMPDISENMKKNDLFIGDLLAPFEMKFNKFNKQEDPKFIEPKKRNLKRKLTRAELKQKKLGLDPEKAKSALWKKAIDKASGVKIKDDPKILKKVLKRKTNEKKRSQKKWAERLSHQEDVKNRREKKKNENIQKAKSRKKNSKKR